MNDLAVRGSPLEYWFFRLNTGPLALLVDFIIRRSIDAAEVRVSLAVDGRGRVERLNALTWVATGETVEIGECTFDREGSKGRVADIEWDIQQELGGSRIDPAVPPIRWIHPFDMEIASRPRVRFSGQVRMGDITYPCVGVPGLVSHYWGRRLPDRWWWISADLFEGIDVAVEAVLVRTRVWKVAPLAIATGYLWIEQHGRPHMVIHPLNGLIGVEGTPENFAVTARRLGRPGLVVRCSAPPDAYVDLGEGINQTLLGTCLIEGVGEARGTAGLEFRSWAAGSTTELPL